MQVKSDCQHSPALVGGETPIGALGRLRRCGVIRPWRVQDAPDGRGRGHGQALFGEVFLQGQWAGVEPVGGEVLVQQHHCGDDFVVDRAGAAGRRREQGSIASRRPSW
jgi:hypothetical protein